MSTLVETAPGSKTRLRTGGILNGLVVLFLAFGAVMKFVKPAPGIQAFAQTGWPDRLAAPLGIIVLTGYLGGAVATHLRKGDPLFSHVLSPLYMDVLLWAGLYLHEDRLRALVPLRS